MVCCPIPYCMRYSATRQFISTAALHLRQGFYTLVQNEVASVPGLPVRVSIKHMRKHSKLARGRPGMIHHVRVGQ